MSEPRVLGAFVDALRAARHKHGPSTDAEIAAELPAAFERMDLRLVDADAARPTDGLDPEYEVRYGQPLCASCHHPHTDGAWVETDPNDGTCWSAGALVCGCPKFITPAVKRMRMADYERRARAEGTKP